MFILYKNSNIKMMNYHQRKGHKRDGYFLLKIHNTAYIIKQTNICKNVAWTESKILQKRGLQWNANHYHNENWIDSQFVKRNDNFMETISFSVESVNYPYRFRWCFDNELQTNRMHPTWYRASHQHSCMCYLTAAKWSNVWRFNGRTLPSH